MTPVALTTATTVSPLCVRFRVDVGKTFTVQITKSSFKNMGLNLNEQIYLAFKASSVQMI
jgi:molybdopterin-binding protein